MINEDVKETICTKCNYKAFCKYTENALDAQHKIDVIPLSLPTDVPFSINLVCRYRSEKVSYSRTSDTTSTSTNINTNLR